MNAHQSLRRTGAVASAAALFVFGLGASTADAASDATPPAATITKAPTSAYVRQGATVQLDGTCAGLTDGTGYVTVTVTLNGNDVASQEFVPSLDENGAWGVPLTADADTTPVGNWQFTAQCFDYDLGGGSTASTSVTILAVASGTLDDTTLAAAGETVTVSAKGFAPGESVSGNVDGKLLGTVTTHDDGTILGEMTLSGASLGAHTLRLVGASSGTVVELPFTVVSGPVVKNPPVGAPAPATPAATPDATAQAPASALKPAATPKAGTGLPRAASDVVL